MTNNSRLTNGFWNINGPFEERPKDDFLFERVQIINIIISYETLYEEDKTPNIFMKKTSLKIRKGKEEHLLVFNP